MGYGLIIAAVMLEVFAQLAFKRGTASAALEVAPGRALAYWMRLGTSGWIGAGIALYGVELLCWIAALHDVPLNVAFPAMSLSYCGVAVGAHYWLREAISTRSALAIAMIAAGVALVVWPA
jgi:undecaprenyl phosphate-alpha-L-ara4N flippase subunit ArnF